MKVIPSAEGRVFVGLDSEFFYKKDNKVLSAHHVLPSKYEPYVVLEDRTGASSTSLGKGVAFHYDGLQAEFNAVESTNTQDVMRRVRHALKFALELAKENGLDFSLDGCVPVDVSELQSFPPDAVEFGCDIDFISWLGGRPNPIMISAEDHPFRYAGTHLHLGAPEDATDSWGKKLQNILLGSYDLRAELVNTLDLLVGNTAVMLDQSPASTLRRKLYGKAGTYRPTEYGVEYRVLSSFALVAPQLLPLLWALARESIRLVASGEHQSLFYKVGPENIIRAINENDFDLAKSNWSNLRQQLDGFFVEPDLVETADCKPLRAIDFVTEVGAGNVFSEDLTKNWKLDEDDHIPTWSQSYPLLLEIAGFSKEFDSYAK